MAYIFGKIKCYFCGDKDGFMHSVCDYGIYGDLGKRIFYHSECLEMIEMDPERFGHTMMDKAIHIGGMKQENINECNNTIAEKFTKKVQTLHKNHFERLMPRNRS